MAKVWQKKMAASYSVEASYIMAMTLLALSVLIRSAYAEYREETNIMRLHHIVEQLRGWDEYGEKKERTISGGEWIGQVSRYEKEVEGILKSQTKEREIETKIHAPEDMMRMMTIFQAEGEG